MQENITAAILIIGNEILSGKTQDVNVQYIAQNLSEMGIALKEVRVVADIKSDIVFAVNELRHKYAYLFTTGGIGPTHDDITAESVASAFDLKLEQDHEALEIMQSRYLAMGREMHPASYKMAEMPVGAELILNNVSGAPGFSLENVYVMAGIPDIMRGMFDWLKSKLKTGRQYISKGLLVDAGESSIAKLLQSLNDQFPLLDMGSYPFQDSAGIWHTNLIIRGQDHENITLAFIRLKEILSAENIIYREI